MGSEKGLFNKGEYFRQNLGGSTIYYTVIDSQPSPNFANKFSNNLLYRTLPRLISISPLNVRGSYHYINMGNDYESTIELNYSELTDDLIVFLQNRIVDGNSFIFCPNGLIWDKDALPDPAYVENPNKTEYLVNFYGQNPFEKVQPANITERVTIKLIVLGII